MSSRTRQELRDDTISRIIAAATVAGSNVFGNRMIPLELSELPSVAVYVSSEQGSRRTRARPAEYGREMTVELHCTVDGAGGGDADVDATLDGLLDEVIAATVGDSGWGSANHLELVGGYELSKEFTIDGDVRLMRGVLRVDVQAEMLVF